MYRVTTPEHVFTLPDAAESYRVIRVTYKQGNVNLTKEYNGGVLPSGMTFDGRNVFIVLTQTETKAFKAGTAYVQVRALTNAGKAYASKNYSIEVQEVNDDTVLQYEEQSQ